MLVQIRSFLPELCQGCPSSTEAKQSGGKDSVPGDPHGLGRPTRELGREMLTASISMLKKKVYFGVKIVYISRKKQVPGFTALKEFILVD